MKTVTVGLLMIVLSLAGGCAPYATLDRHFGETTQASLDKQVAYPTAPSVQKLPKGMAGINAAEVMEVFNKTYTEKPQKTDVYSLQSLPGGMEGQ